MGALIYLTLVSLKNRIRVRLRRLREVRYAVGLAVGLLYFYFIIGGGHTSSTGVYGAFAAQRGPVEMVASLILFAIVVLTWAWPSDGKATLMFTRAEVQFLFPAPFSRRQLISYKLTRMLFGSLLSSAIITVFFRPSTVASGWMFLAGFALVTSILLVHLSAVSLVRASLREHGRFGLAHQWIPIAVVLSAVAILVGTLVNAWPRLSAIYSNGLLMSELHRLSTHGLAGIVLWPFRAVVQLPLAPTPSDFLRALPVPLVLLTLNFIWAVRSDAAFEEASAELAERVARVRRGTEPVLGAVQKRNPPFVLATTGPAEIALLWKNLIMLGRYATVKRAAAFLPAALLLGILFSLFARKEGTADAFAMLCLMLTFITVFMGPMVIRNDLRRDLERIAVLKSWPVRGAALLRGEALAPTVVLTVVAWFFVLGTLTSLARVLSEVGLSVVTGRFSYTLAALILAPGIIATQVLVHNGMAVMFPAWMATNTSQGRGVDMMGQRMLLLGGVMLALVLAVLPAVVVATIVAGAVYFTISVIPVILPSAVVTAILLIECIVATELLGRLLDRTDPAAVEVTE